MARYKQEQVSHLTRRTKARKRIKGDSASSSSQDTDPPPTVNDRAFPVDAGIRPLETDRLSGAEKGDISSYLLRDAITQIGWDHWRKKRSTGGKMAYWRIQVCSARCTPHVVVQLTSSCVPTRIPQILRLGMAMRSYHLSHLPGR